MGTVNPDKKGRAVIARIRSTWREHKPSAVLLTEWRSQCSQYSQREQREYTKHAKSL
jgi:hypothetical protein